jgi:hypothetical protein
MRIMYGDRSVCALCGQDIEWSGAKHRWKDRGANRECVPYRDKNGEILRPRKDQKHNTKV